MLKCVLAFPCIFLYANLLQLKGDKAVMRNVLLKRGTIGGKSTSLNPSTKPNGRKLSSESTFTRHATEAVAQARANIGDPAMMLSKKWL